MGRGGGDNEISPERLLYGGGIRVQGRNRQPLASWGEEENLWGTIETDRGAACSLLREDGNRVVYWMDHEGPQINLLEDRRKDDMRWSVRLPGRATWLDRITEVNGDMVAVWSKTGGKMGLGWIQPFADNTITELAEFDPGDDRAALVSLGNQLLCASIKNGMLVTQVWNPAGGSTNTETGLGASRILTQGSGEERSMILVASQFGGEPSLHVFDLETGAVEQTIQTSGEAASASLARAGDGHWVISYRNGRGQALINDGSQEISLDSTTLNSTMSRDPELGAHSYGPWSVSADDGSVYVAWANDQQGLGASVELGKMPEHQGGSLRRTTIAQEAHHRVGEIRICPDSRGARVAWKVVDAESGEYEEIFDAAWSGEETSPRPVSIFRAQGNPDWGENPDQLIIESFDRDRMGQISILLSSYEDEEAADQIDGPAKSGIFRRLLRT